MNTRVIDLANLYDDRGFVIYRGDNKNDLRSFPIGDVNNDGCNDIIIGMQYYSAVNYLSLHVLYGCATNVTIDLSRLTYKQGFSIYYNNATNIKGSSLCSFSSAGDINKDGFDDVIIGIQDQSAKHKEKSGISYVIFGSINSTDIDLSNLNLTIGFTIYGAQASDLSGHSVSYAGDVNADGYDDIVIGAPGAHQLSYYHPKTGAAYVIFGTSTPTNIDLENFNITQGFSIFGTVYHTGHGDIGFTGDSVSTAGDFNGDGYDDVIVGNPMGSNYQGTVYVIFGKSIPTNIDLQHYSSSEALAIGGAIEGSSIGSFISAAGDINDDGCDDIIIYSGYKYTNSKDYQYKGQTYIIFGRKNSNFINLSKFNRNEGMLIYSSSFYSTSYSNSEGIFVNGVLDINLDGKNDIIVGYTQRSASNERTAGKVLIIYGDAIMPATLDLSNLNNSQYSVVYGIASGDYLDGRAIYLANMNNDSYADLVISTYNTLPSKPDASKFFVIYGRENSDFTYVTSGDVSPTNVIDLASDSVDIKISGAFSQPYDRGSQASSVGDVNGDGCEDIIIGSNYASPESKKQAGVCYIIYGCMMVSKNLDLVDFNKSQGFVIYGAAANDQIGISVSSAGDINHDGYDDIIIGAPYAALNIKNRWHAGISYVIFGNATSTDIDLSNLEPTRGFVIYGAREHDLSGSCVNKAGDINGDGHDDILISAPQGDVIDPMPRLHSGKVYVILGSLTPTNIDLLNFTTSQGFTVIGTLQAVGMAPKTGYSAGTARDFNGDGYDDIVIGEPFYSKTSPQCSGRSYVIFGSDILLDIDVKSLSINQGIIIEYDPAHFQKYPDIRIGWSVSSAGDINKDGYDDVIVSSETSLPNVGQAFIIFGCEVPNNIDLYQLNKNQGLIIKSGEQIKFYTYVSSAGDVNNDGYDDIIIGTPLATPSLRLNAGMAFVIYGSNSMPASIDLLNMDSNQGFLIYGATEKDYLGKVGSIGDFNNDGYDDIIVSSSRSQPVSPQYIENSIYYVIYGRANSEIISSFLPSLLPTLSPNIHYNTNTPTIVATIIPSENKMPTYISTLSPTDQPTNIPSLMPTTVPTNVPIHTPTLRPTDKPTNIPSLSPTTMPTNIPIHTPTLRPTDKPTNTPSLSPTTMPTNVPIHTPTLRPTDKPTNIPSLSPTTMPTNIPIHTPTLRPTDKPTNTPSLSSTTMPTNIPMHPPTIIPTDKPTNIPSKIPTIAPSIAPTFKPSFNPSVLLTFKPSIISTDVPTVAPTLAPSFIPTPDSTGYKNLNLDTLTAVQGFILSGTANSESGYSVSSAGDVNGDGYNDVIIGAPYTNSGTGISYVIYGGKQLSSIDYATLTKKEGFSIIGINANDYSGRSVGSAGDVNGDGYDDIIISAPHANSYKGQSYIIYGGLYLPSVIDLINLGTRGVTITGSEFNDLSGWSVSTAGDVNNDGYDDIIIGAPYAKGAAGEVYVIYGAESLSSEIMITNMTMSKYGLFIFGFPENSQGGYSVCSAGDVNGDSYDDVIIGSPYSNSGIGIIYVVYGGLALPSSLNLKTLTKEQGFYISGFNTNSHSGYSVSGAGDINKDGYADLVIGSPYANSYIGKSYIIYGGKSLSPLNLAYLSSDEGVSIIGSSINGYCGISVSSAGDVNKDGYDDIIIGANGVSDNRGISYVVYGGKFLPSIINLEFLKSGYGFSVTGAKTNSLSGYSVSGAGDINNDGYSDIIIGSPYESSGAGKSYVIYGNVNGFVNEQSTDLTALPQDRNLYFGSNLVVDASVIGAVILLLSIGYTAYKYANYFYPLLNFCGIGTSSPTNSHYNLLDQSSDPELEMGGLLQPIETTPV